MFSAATKTGSQPSAAANYIESVFSTYLTTGAGSNITVNNGIDLAGKGGLVWQKPRNSAGYHTLFDTVRGANYYLFSNTTNAQGFSSNILPTFNSDGFVIGTDNNLTTSGTTGVNWTFRKQPKFFDVVTYTGNGAGSRTISHNLGSAPGMIIIKNTSSATDWAVWHRGDGTTWRSDLSLNTTGASGNSGTTYLQTSTEIQLSQITTAGGSGVNSNGQTFVAYLFAHNAGGFGTSGTDNVISCGSFTTDGTGKATVSLGYEPQYVLWKQTDGADNWYVNDVMRGMNVSGSDRNLSPNTSSAESAGGYDTTPNATGFIANPGIASKNYIYMAIRRPMKVPTDATTVFSPIAYTGNGASGQTLTGPSLPPDLSIFQYRSGIGGGAVGQFVDRLRGGSAYLAPSSTGAEGNTSGYYIRSFNMDGITYGTSYVDYNYNTNLYSNWMFVRRPGFFDEVCYTGTGSARTVAHNLTVVPELMIVKRRNATDSWWTYSSSLGNTKYLYLNTAGEFGTYGVWNNTTPTTSVFSVNLETNTSAGTYVAYLFATCAGVSKVGSYTGNGTTQAIACGFTGGARFVLIKRTDNSGEWYVYDTARGMTVLTNPYLELNTTDAEVATLGSVTTTTGGFTVNASILSAINTSGASYIFLAIA